MTDLKLARPAVVRRTAADVPLKQRVTELVDEVHRLLDKVDHLNRRVNALTQENARRRARLEASPGGPKDAA